MTAQALSESQLEYLVEVLGADPSRYQTLSRTPATSSFAAPPEVEVHDLIVLVPPLNSSEQELLSKVLASAKLTDFQQVTKGHAADKLMARHVLNFGCAIPGRRVEGDSVWWDLPSLTDMTGANGLVPAAVTALKKETWNLLQQLMRERGA